MFEQTVIRRHDRSVGRTIIDAGLLAEALLFYSRVHLLLDGSALESLLKKIGPDALISLLESGRASATFLSDNLAVLSKAAGLITFHNYCAVTFGAEKGGKRIGPRDAVQRTCEQLLGKSASTRRIAKRLSDLFEFRPHERVKRLPNGKIVPIDDAGIIGLTRTDTLDVAYLHQAIEAVLRTDVPSFHIPADWSVDVFNANESGYVCSTTLDFDRINAEYHKGMPSKENTITMGWILVQMLQARADLYFAADYMSEFVTDPLSSSLAKMRFNDLLKRRTKSSYAIEAFQDALLDSGTALREAINSGERTFAEFITLLDRADRFKEWLRGQNPDAKLLEEYHREVTRETWIEKLPAKLVRLAICTLGGIGLEALAPGGSGLVGGVAMHAADTFFLERLARGWRPNQFVEGEMLRFVDQS